MKIIPVFWLFIGVDVFFVGCTGINKPPVATERASEKTIIAALGQGLLGSSFAAMTPDERRRALEAEYKALEYSKANANIDWHSKKGIAYGTVTPGQPYRVGSQNCRQYSHSSIVNNIPLTLRGSACRNPDGSWSPLM